MLRLEICQKEDSLYAIAHEFARQKYLLPRMNMRLYYYPTVLICAQDSQGEIAGVIGGNIGFVGNNMLLLDSRTREYMNHGVACDQAIFAIDETRITLAPYVLCAALAVLAARQGMKYMGVLAIEVSRKIMKKLGVVSLHHPEHEYGFGLPDVRLIPEEHQSNWDTWFAYNHPTSLEVVDLEASLEPCTKVLVKFTQGGRIEFGENYVHLF